MGTKHSNNIYALADTPNAQSLMLLSMLSTLTTTLYILKYSNKKYFDISLKKFHNWNYE